MRCSLGFSELMSSDVALLCPAYGQEGMLLTLGGCLTSGDRRHRQSRMNDQVALFDINAGKWAVNPSGCKWAGAASVVLRLRGGGGPLHHHGAQHGPRGPGGERLTGQPDGAVNGAWGLMHVGRDGCGRWCERLWLLKGVSVQGCGC